MTGKQQTDDWNNKPIEHDVGRAQGDSGAGVPMGAQQGRRGRHRPERTQRVRLPKLKLVLDDFLALQKLLRFFELSLHGEPRIARAHVEDPRPKQRADPQRSETHLNISELGRLHRKHLGLVRELHLGPLESRRSFLQNGDVDEQK
jgi:hypothetical protein